MKKQFILGIMALAALVSCSKSEVLQQESLKEKAISFSTYLGKQKQTKATTIDGNNVDEAGIGVMAWRTGGDNISSPILESQAPAFMNNILLTWDGTTATYTPERYWPSTGAKVSFFAYAPYATGGATLPENADPNNNLYHPENITFTTTGGNSHILTLNVPNGATGVEYAKHTDFMVAKVGNGDWDATNEKWLGTIGAAAGTNGTYTNAQTVGINQNLNKDYDGKVLLQMKHALSKISFVAKAEDDKGVQTLPYSDGLVKVVFDEIELVGEFTNSGSYNLFTQAWDINQDQTNLHSSYKLVNAAGTENDPFTAMADELYNNEAYELVQGSTEWYKLNKSSHDMMIIPCVKATIPAVADNPETDDVDESAEAQVFPAKITNVKGQYTVKTYAQKKVTVTETIEGVDTPVEKLVYLKADGTETFDATTTENGVPVNNKPAIGDEIESYRDVVKFGVNEQGTETPFANPILLEEGKAYTFQFNIKLNKIEFSVTVESWEDGGSYSIINTYDGSTGTSSGNNGQTTGGNAGGTEPERQ